MSQFNDQQLASFYELSSILEGIQRRVWIEEKNKKKPAQPGESLSITKVHRNATKTV